VIVSEVMKRHVFCLLTDFGLADPYVCQMKARILSEIEDAFFLDISHQIDAHNLYQGGFFLASTWEYLPRDCIVLAVVDPGVGSERDILIILKDNKWLICPDNGVVSELLYRHPSREEIYRLRRGFFRGAVSSTFHGRDVFAPVAIELARGKGATEMGEPLSRAQISTLEMEEISLQGGRLSARIIHIDRFGNCVLNIPSCWWTSLRVRERIFLRGPVEIPLWIVMNYSSIPPGDAGILDGSQGYLELAMNQESFARRYNMSIGDRCILDLGIYAR